MNLVIRIVVLASILAHLWAGCRCCCAWEAQAKYLQTKPRHDHGEHTACKAAGIHAHHHIHQEDALCKTPAKTPCQDPRHHSDHGCDFCQYGFIVSTTTGTSISSAFKIDLPINPLPPDLLPLGSTLFTGSAFYNPSPENVTLDPRSFRARISVFLL